MTTGEWELAAICILLAAGIWLLLGAIARLDQLGGVLNGMAQDSRKGQEHARELIAGVDGLHETLSSIEDCMQRIDDRIQAEIEGRERNERLGS
jgi:hypothetical protein